MFFMVLASALPTAISAASHGICVEHVDVCLHLMIVNGCLSLMQTPSKPMVQMHQAQALEGQSKLGGDALELHLQDASCKASKQLNSSSPNVTFAAV